MLCSVVQTFLHLWLDWSGKSVHRYRQCLIHISFAIGFLVLLSPPWVISRGRFTGIMKRRKVLVGSQLYHWNLILRNSVPKQSFSSTEDCTQYVTSQTSAGVKFNNLLLNIHLLLQRFGPKTFFKQYNSAYNRRKSLYTLKTFWCMNTLPATITSRSFWLPKVYELRGGESVDSVCGAGLRSLYQLPYFVPISYTWPRWAERLLNKILQSVETMFHLANVDASSGCFCMFLRTVQLWPIASITKATSYNCLVYSLV